MLGYYNYTVVLTYIGMLFGFSGILQTLNGNYHGAVMCLMAAGLCDMFDGKVASTMQRTRSQKRFGIQIDSLSDLICFGVLPAVIACTGSTLKWAPAASGIYCLCALIRLAWFNVDEEERQEKEDGSRRVYYGLPVTSAALIIPMILGITGRSASTAEVAGPVLMLVMAVAFITPFQLKKPETAGKAAILLCGVAEMGLLLKGMI